MFNFSDAATCTHLVHRRRDRPALLARHARYRKGHSLLMMMRNFVVVIAPPQKRKKRVAVKKDWQGWVEGSSPHQRSVSTSTRFLYYKREGRGVVKALILSVLAKMDAYCIDVCMCIFR